MTVRGMTVSDIDRLEHASPDDQCVLRMDDSTFTVFYNRTARALWAYLFRITRDAAQADDLLQEAYYRLLRTDVAASDEGHRRNYLYRIATNLVRDGRRRSRGVQVDLPEENTPETLGTCDRRQRNVPERADLARAMTRLSDRERELLWLAYGEGATHREIAGALGLKSGSIRLLLFRARRRLADALRRTVPESSPSGTSTQAGGE